MALKFLVTGGAGFIGSAVARKLIRQTDHRIHVLGKLTCTGHLDSNAPVDDDPRYGFVQRDICGEVHLRRIFAEFRPDMVMHLAAANHVDRSTDRLAAFIKNNMLGIYVLLQAALEYWRGLLSDKPDHFRFHPISIAEGFGSLGLTGHFHEEIPYQPSSSYSASKAGSDHLVRAWRHTYGLPTVETNCSNNYGIYHFLEKLTPMMILNALEGRPLSAYGSGQSVRDWLYVDDHADALLLVASGGGLTRTTMLAAATR